MSSGIKGSLEDSHLFHKPALMNFQYLPIVLSLNFWRQGTSLNLELALLTRLASQNILGLELQFHA